MKNKKKLYREIESFKGTHINDAYKNITIDVILISPETSGNIGSIARIMKNFNFPNLIVFNPKVDISEITAYETQGFAMHGKDILLNAEIIELNNQEEHNLKLDTLLKRYDLTIGTTAKGKRYTNVKRLGIFPDHLEFPISENDVAGIWPTWTYGSNKISSRGW